jgi:hypothetical protein
MTPTWIPARLVAPLAVALFAFAPLPTLPVLRAQDSAATTQKRPQLFGHLQELDGTTILHLSGTDRQRGFTEGYLRAKRLQAFFDGWALRMVPSATWDFMVRPTLHARFAFPGWARDRARGLVEGMKARDPRFLQSKHLGRKLQYADVLAVAALIDGAGLMCSSIATWGVGVAGQGPIVTRNLDYRSNDTMLANTLVIHERGTQERPATISIGWSCLGITTALSDAGVFVAIHDVPSKALEKRGHTPRIHALQELLWKLKPAQKSEQSVAERARAILAEHRFAFGGNAMVSWKSGEERGACVLEFGPAPEGKSSVSLRESGANRWIACTNHYRDRQQPRRCRRYADIVGGIAGAAAAQAPAEPPAETAAEADPAQELDAAALWRIAGEARVNITLHTVQVDFAKQRLKVEFRVKSKRPEWRMFERPLAKIFGSKVPATAVPEER